MIITHINGGLGNQMFQYAAGRALALRHGAELLLDTRIFDGSTQFGLGLHHFAIAARQGLPAEMPPERRQQRLRYLIWRGLKLKPHLLRENGLSYNAAFESAGDGVYLKGYWQSERYFKPVEAAIRADFQIVTPPSPANAAVLAELAERPAISLHIRRGDYVKDSRTNATHGTCSLDYYRRAVDLIAARMTEKPVIYTFSDDPAWVRDNLILPFAMRVMDHNDSDHNYEDLRLMSACRHHVIANSSFSWWGAWLNPSEDKIVVSPDRWFADPKLVNEDIWPESWVRLA
ncbi:alpha-1,2-fucosyltransferase [Hoeflea sp.]|uniref:alpha-1,2-fucosyltransferase n=1 Tax=Hoeflea sp. TaxID=1940281 RepID=UPI0019884D9E|nr:alpha-1,2-fucosyltransferase [Hoeflea sp.]MBC7282754.1 alpha-1,2-fucosyltransferase [Hoeflea sp.]